MKLFSCFKNTSIKGIDNIYTIDKYFSKYEEAQIWTKV